MTHAEEGKPLVQWLLRQRLAIRALGGGKIGAARAEAGRNEHSSNRSDENREAGNYGCPTALHRWRSLIATARSWSRFAGLRSTPACIVETQVPERLKTRTSEEWKSALPVWAAASTPNACQTGRNLRTESIRKSRSEERRVGK